MTDITAELAALPKMPMLPQRDPFKDLESWHFYLGSRCKFLEARLAIAERQLAAWCDGVGQIDDARAYLAFRAKEQQT